MAAFFWISPWYATLEKFLVFCFILNVSGSSAILQMEEMKKWKELNLFLSLDLLSELFLLIFFFYHCTISMKPHLCQFSFCFLKFSMIFYIRLNLGVFGYPPQFRRFSDGRCLCFRNVPINSKKMIYIKKASTFNKCACTHAFWLMSIQFSFTLSINCFSSSLFISPREKEIIIHKPNKSTTTKYWADWWGRNPKKIYLTIVVR